MSRQTGNPPILFRSTRTYEGGFMNSEEVDVFEVLLDGEPLALAESSGSRGFIRVPHHFVQADRNGLIHTNSKDKN
jgi:hypothetical protein